MMLAAVYGLILSGLLAFQSGENGTYAVKDHFPGGVLKTCSSFDVLTSSVVKTNFAFGGVVKSHEVKSYKIEGLPFSASDVWSFDGSSGRIYLNDGRAVQANFSSGNAFSIASVRISCGPVQQPRKLDVGRASRDSPKREYPAEYSLKLTNGAIISLSKSGSTSTLKLDSPGKQTAIIMKTDDAISAISVAQSIDAPSINIDTVGYRSGVRFILNRVVVTIR